MSGGKLRPQGLPRRRGVSVGGPRWGGAGFDRRGAVDRGRRWARWIEREARIFWRDLNRPERGFRRSLTLSAVVHGIALAGLTLSPSCHSAAVGLESRPIVFEYRPLDVPEPKPAAPKPKPQPKKEVPPPETKAPAKAKLPEERPRPEPPKPSPKPPEPEPQPQAEAPAADSSRSLPPAPQPVALARVDEPQFAYDYYLQTVVGKVSEVWEPPAGLAARGAATEATLVFRISPQGRVVRTEVEEGSPLGLFDRSAAEAIRRAQPYPPFPPAYRGRWLTIHLRFRFDP